MYNPKSDGDNAQHKGNTMSEKKYELTKDVLTTASGSKVYRIRAVRTFTNGKNTIEAGTYGGYVESEKNLSHDGGAWVYGVARAYENAVVEGNAALRGLVAAKGNAVIGGDIIVSGTGDIDGNISITGNRPIHLNGEILAGEGTLTLNRKHY